MCAVICMHELAARLPLDLSGTLWGVSTKRSNKLKRDNQGWSHRWLFWGGYYHLLRHRLKGGEAFLTCFSRCPTFPPPPFLGSTYGVNIRAPTFFLPSAAAHPPVLKQARAQHDGHRVHDKLWSSVSATHSWVAQQAQAAEQLREARPAVPLPVCWVSRRHQ